MLILRNRAGNISEVSWIPIELTNFSDGVNQSRQPVHSASSSPTSSIGPSAIHTPPRTPSPPAETSSHVQWVPLSPQSSQTLLRHRKSRSRDNIDEDKGEEDATLPVEDTDSAIVPRRRFRKRRRNSNPSNDRPLVSRHRDGPIESDRSSASEEEIEVLPDRFDPYGRPIDGSSTSRQQQPRGWTQRRGDFEYRSPRPGGTQVRGTWGVAGTDPEQVERMMQNVSGVLAGDMPRGMAGWLGLAGKLLGGVMAPEGLDHDEVEEGRGNGEGSSRARGGERGVIAYGGGGSDVSRDERGKGRRRVDERGYYEEEAEEEAPRRQRRRRRRELE